MKKFRDMTDSDKLEIINAMIAGERVETTCEKGDWWYATGGVNFNKVYRIPKRPMSIDWSVLKDEYICAARDKSGHGYAYKKEPTKDACTWDVDDSSDAIWICPLTSYDPGTVDWQDSLIWRPGYGDNK